MGDRFCQRLADAATLGGTWRAWVATPTSSPSTRFTRGALPYRLLNGTQIAANYSLLTALRGLDAPIRLTEQGLAPSCSAEGSTCAVYTVSYGNGEFVRYQVTRDVYGTSCDELTNSGSRAPLNLARRRLLGEPHHHRGSGVVVPLPLPRVRDADGAVLLRAVKSVPPRARSCARVTSTASATTP